MKKRFAIAVFVAGLLVPVPLSATHHASRQAMTCSPDEPVRTACGVVFGTVLGTVCTGHAPKPPAPGATTAATIGWPVHCPPLG